MSDQVVLRVYCPSGARHAWELSGAGRYKHVACRRCSSVLGQEEMLKLYIAACDVGEEAPADTGAGVK